MTQVIGEASSTSLEAQSIIAVFDDWESLQAILGELADGETRGGTTVLYSPPPIGLPATASPRLSNEAVDLHFVAAGQRICCTTGEVAEALGESLAGGARSLGDALCRWLRTDQAWQLETHVEKGRIVLWLQPSTSEQFYKLCGRLVKASRHLVGLCNLKSSQQAGRSSQIGVEQLRTGPRHSRRNR
jgi:hypothetical protein